MKYYRLWMFQCFPMSIEAMSGLFDDSFPSIVRFPTLSDAIHFVDGQFSELIDCPLIHWSQY